MENIISINHTKKNTIEFDLTTEGLETKGMEVFLVVKTKDLDIRFKCKDKKKEDKWEVEVPVLNHLLEKTAYNCQIEVISDGYHFIPMKGSLNVVGSAEIYTTEPKNKTLESDKEKAKDAKAEKEKEDKAKKLKEDWVRPGSYTSNPMSKSVAQLAEEAVAAHKAEEAAQNKKSSIIQAAAELIEESAEPGNEKSRKLAAILESVGITPTKKKESRFSLK